MDLHRRFLFLAYFSLIARVISRFIFRFTRDSCGLEAAGLSGCRARPATVR
jgi:hypothetical protein